jgi:hypothetical protein
MKIQLPESREKFAQMTAAGWQLLENYMEKRLQQCKISLRNTSRQTKQETGLNILPL